MSHLEVHLDLSVPKVALLADVRIRVLASKLL